MFNVFNVKNCCLLLVTVSLINSEYAFGGKDDESLITPSSTSITIAQRGMENPFDDQVGTEGSLHSGVELEEGITASDQVQEVMPNSIGRRLGGYLTRCGTIACTTLVGGSIGLAIVSGELTPETAYTLLKVGSPIIVGSLAGYGAGWIGGNILKARINRRI